MKKTGVLRRTLVVSDNFRIINFLRDFLKDKGLSEIVDIVCSPKAPENVLGLPGLRPVNVAAEAKEIVEAYRLVISAHCKQIFPEQLYASVECVNIHPGFNPETRGWFPQVWAIVFGHKVGVTVHLIDRELDHGEIIDRIPVQSFIWDTSKSLYDRILDAEIEWLQKNLEDLLSSNYSTTKMGSDGNLFLKRDFERLCELSLSEQGTFQEFYNRLRALSFDGYRNAYFVDPETNKKIYVEITITPDDAG
jgi:methionyl-tRNA formyltransferase